MYVLGYYNLYTIKSLEKILKQERFEINPAASNATKLWRHWLATFENFLAAIESDNLNKLTILTNYVSTDVYEIFGEANEVFARHSLSTRKQQPDESIDEYLQVLKSLSKECNYRQVSAVQYREETIRDTCIRGLQKGN